MPHCHKSREGRGLGRSSEVWLDEALRDKIDLHVYAFGHLLVRSASPLRMSVAPSTVSVAYF